MQWGDLESRDSIGTAWPQPSSGGACQLEARCSLFTYLRAWGRGWGQPSILHGCKHPCPPGRAPGTTVASEEAEPRPRNVGPPPYPTLNTNSKCPLWGHLGFLPENLCIFWLEFLAQHLHIYGGCRTDLSATFM